MATIMSLPVELQMEIAFCLDNTTLLAFRQTTIDLGTASSNAFTERFFRRRSHIVSPHSLKILEEVSCSSLARHVRELRFIACPRAPNTISSWLFPIPDFQQLLGLRSENSKLLAQIFKNFKDINAANRSVECSTDFDWFPLRGWTTNTVLAKETTVSPTFGVKSIIDALGVDTSRGKLRAGSIDNLFRIVANALLQSGHTVASLNLGLSSWNKLNFIESFDSFSQVELSRLFQNTKNLELGFDKTEMPDCVADWSAILESGNFERLAIGCREFHFGCNLAQSLADTSIVAVALCGMAVDTATINHFFSQLPRQVKSVELLDLDLNVANNWNEVLEYLLAAALESVVLRNLANGELFERAYFTDQYNRYLYGANGRREVTELLTRLMKNGSCGHGPDFLDEWDLAQ